VSRVFLSIQSRPIHYRLQDARGFIAHTLVKILHGEGQRALFFRVLDVDVLANSMRLRMERFTLFWQRQDVQLVRACRCIFCIS
jgi:hypothetical protein